MSKITTAKELVEACINATKHKTLYIMGCFGAPMNAANKKRYTANHSYNKQAERTAKINAASADTFGFDCVCLIKGLLWGWNGDATRTYGGANYAVNGVPDIDADSMIKACKEISTDFSKIVPGEAVWTEGHIGVYIGDGLAVECTHRWDDCVQITAVHNIGTKPGYNGRKWTKHGKLPYITYVEEVTKPTTGEKPLEKLPEIGDIVDFKGITHFASSDAKKGKKCKPGRAMVTDRNLGAAHPIHLVNQPGSGSSVHGWVDLADIAAAGTSGKIEKNSRVKIKKGAVYGGLSTARGKGVPERVCDRTMTVKKIQVNNGVKEALLQEINSWVAVASLTAV